MWGRALGGSWVYSRAMARKMGEVIYCRCVVEVRNGFAIDDVEVAWIRETKSYLMMTLVSTLAALETR
jgi:hypothetical protein